MKTRRHSSYSSPLFSQAILLILKNRLFQFLGFLILSLATLLFISLCRYDPTHLSWNTATNTPVDGVWSFGESLSAIVADVLLQSFGFSAFFVIFILAIWSIVLLKQRPIPHIARRSLMLIGGLFCLAIFLGCFPTKGQFLVTPTPGGAIGELLLKLCQRLSKIKSLPLLGGIFLGGFLFMAHGASGMKWSHWKLIFRRVFLAKIPSSQKGDVSSTRTPIVGGRLSSKLKDKISGLNRLLPLSMFHKISSFFDKEDVSLSQATSRRSAFDTPALQNSTMKRKGNDFSVSEEDRFLVSEGRARSSIEIKSKVYDDPEESTESVHSQNLRNSVHQGPQYTFSTPLYNQEYELPDINLLDPLVQKKTPIQQSEDALQDLARQLEQVLQEFGVRGEIVGICPGPVVTLYELKPAAGIKTSRVIGLADDIARSMSAHAARIAVIPGRNVIGIELPNPVRETVYLRELLMADEYKGHPAPLAMILGKDIGGNPIVVDLARMPHLLVAGTTGSGKSVSINTMILSILFRMSPDKCKFIMIDPKMLEFSAYDGIPHLLTPVVTDPKKAVVALKWAVREMENRYRSMSKLGVRNIDGYNARLEEVRQSGEILMRRVQTGFDPDTGKPIFENQALDVTPLPYIVIVVDEMADLMLVAGKEIEVTVQRLAQMARAAGIHLIMATQRPSVDVITGTIKANFPTRISFMVTSKIDSRTILGEPGAEQLLGQGDMLYMMGGGRVTRVHGPFVKDLEVERTVNYLKTQAEPTYIESVTEDDGESLDSSSDNAKECDPLYNQAVEIVRREGKASTSFVQRHLQIGYNRAARMIEQMEKEGIISPANSVGKREVIG